MQMLRRSLDRQLPSLATVARVGVDLLYPERCVHCGSFGRSICEACLAALRDQPPLARCPNCGAHWPGPDNCPRCFRWDALDGAIAAVDYEGTARDMVRALKYRRTKSLAPVMAGFLDPLIAAAGDVAVFPVPLHRSRLRDRGFNQSGLVVRSLGVPPPPGSIRRVRKTKPQFGLSPGGRLRNVAGAFRYDGPSLDGARIVLVDDVITTGATANECARALRDHGAASVRAIAFARANYQPSLPEGAIDL